MNRVETFLFPVTQTGKQIGKSYQGNLGWFFDDAETPIKFPNGIYHIGTYDNNTLMIDLNRKVISLVEAQKFLVGMGITTTNPLKYKKSLNCVFYTGN